MPEPSAVAGRPHGTAIHATAVAIAGRALLILGPSGSGKSCLAARLIEASTRRRSIRLVGDDRILLAPGAGGLLARPHPRIAGFLERRGLGIVAVPFIEAAPVSGVVRLGPTTPPVEMAQNLRALPNVHVCDRSTSSRCDAVLAWWRDAYTTPAAKAPSARPAAAKD